MTQGEAPAARVWPSIRVPIRQGRRCVARLTLLGAKREAPARAPLARNPVLGPAYSLCPRPRYWRNPGPTAEAMTRARVPESWPERGKGSSWCLPDAPASAPAAAAAGPAWCAGRPGRTTGAGSPCRGAAWPPQRWSRYASGGRTSAERSSGRPVGRCTGRPAAPSRGAGRAPFGALRRTPADRHPHAGVVPKRGAGGDIETALGASIPAVDGDPAPGRGRVPQSLGQARQAGTFDRRTPGPAWLAWRGWLAQAGIEAQPGDDDQVRREVA